MKVKDLIKELQKHDQDKIVMIYCDAGEFCSIDKLELKENPDNKQEYLCIIEKI